MGLGIFQKKISNKKNCNFVKNGILEERPCPILVPTKPSKLVGKAIFQILWVTFVSSWYINPCQEEKKTES